MNSNSDAVGTQKARSRLVMCFDGTGNQFLGDPSDTNIVKLYQKLDRGTPNQFHYYQPGIGTYSVDESTVNPGLWGRVKRWVSQTADLGLGTSFDQHVIAGYRFAMRYYDDGDQIFMFGFSRGAFTARFLARMIAAVGLLSKGNEEMVPFAYRTYQEYELGRLHDKERADAYMESFKTTFCRTEAKVHFLGLFDTVGSVGYFDAPFSKKKYLPTVGGTAKYVRHAVALDERRCKFKAALLHQDKPAAENNDEKVKEIFFPGNHGDVGGGWSPKGGKGATEAQDPLQLSDLALRWMIQELELLPDAERLAWNSHKDIFLANIDSRNPDRYSLAVQAPMHDILSFQNDKNGNSFITTFMWNLMEWLPIFKRIEWTRAGWADVYFPPNAGGTRDLPQEAVFHKSVIDRMNSRSLGYKPMNLGMPVSTDKMPIDG